MTRTLVLVILTVLALAAPSQAQQAFPPDGAHIVTSDPSVTLSWSGTAKAYRLDVYMGNQSVYSQPTAGTYVKVPVVPGQLYQWQVTEVATNIAIVGPRMFQVSTNLQRHFDGADGSEGLPGGDATQAGGHDGGAGGSGGNGQDLTVSVTSANKDYVSVRIDGQRQEAFFMPVGSAPVVITSNGGHGGSGGRGGDGYSGYVQSGYDVNGNPRYYMVGGGNGGNGGNGGSGGNGGIVIVRGADAKRFVLVYAEGGLGGRGGPGGRGGRVVTYSAPGAIVYGTAVPGGDGRNGTDGSQGAAGRIMYQP